MSHALKLGLPMSHALKLGLPMSHAVKLGLPGSKHNSEVRTIPMSEPHCEAGTTSLKVMGGLGTVPGLSRIFRSWNKKNPV